MSQKITHDQKETALEARRVLGTMKGAAEVAGISVRTLNEEMNRSAIFKKRMLEAGLEGHANISDGGKQYLIDVALGKVEKPDRNRILAAIALLNAYEPGFRGTTTIQGRVEHDVRVITAVPRPKYLDAPKVKVIDVKKTQKRLKRIEDVIEGVVIKEE